MSTFRVKKIPQNKRIEGFFKKSYLCSETFERVEEP